MLQKEIMPLFVSCLTYNMPRSIVLWDIFCQIRKIVRKSYPRYSVSYGKEGKN